MNVFERAREAWAVFRGRDHPREVRDWSSGSNWGKGVQVTQFRPAYGNGGGWDGHGPSSADRPDRVHTKPISEKTIINSIQNRIAADVAMVEFHHAYIDDNDNFTEVIPGSIEEALRIEANIDQSSFNYMVDLVISMFDEGVVAEVPVQCDRDSDGAITDKEELQLRIGQIMEWRPQEVRVKLYNEQTGQKEDVNLSKREVCIHENPFYIVMNQKNGLLNRLIRKMAILDALDDKQTDNKLNAIFQLPYIVRTDIQRKQARARMQEMEDQLASSKLGITYIDGAEKMVQLNRPIDNGLQTQIEWLTKLFMSYLNITEEILNGTADSKVMANYLQRTVGVVCTVIAQERHRKLLTKKQREDGEAILYVQDPFRLIPITELSDMMDKSVRGAILTPNEWRQIIGYKPSDDEAANMLVNRNMPIEQTPEGAGARVNDGNVPAPVGAMEQSAIPPPKLNRQQCRQKERMERSKVPR